jgi:hypothetical protein
MIDIASNNVNTWLNPTGHSTNELYKFLDDRAKPLIEHERLAVWSIWFQ